MTEATITTARLKLLPFSLADAPAVAALANNRNLYRTLLSLPFPYSEQMAKEWISAHADDFANENRYEFAITDLVTGELYGAIGLSHNKDHRKGELGYWIGASGRVMQKAGMKPVGIFTDNIYKDGKYITEVCCEIINPTPSQAV